MATVIYKSSASITLNNKRDIVTLDDGTILLCCHCSASGYVKHEDQNWGKENWIEGTTKVLTCYPKFNKQFPADWIWEPIRQHESVVWIEDNLPEGGFEIHLIRGFRINDFSNTNRLIVERDLPYLQHRGDNRFRWLVNFEEKTVVCRDNKTKKTRKYEGEKYLSLSARLKHLSGWNRMYE